MSVRPAIRLAGLILLAAGVLAPARALAADPAYRKQLNRDVQASWVITVADSGDLILFGGAITVPAHRPSADFCGAWVTTPAPARAQRRAQMVKDAERGSNQLTVAERRSIQLKALEPVRRCEADLRRHCEQTIGRLPRGVRAQAVREARAAIQDIGEAKLPAAVNAYLDELLRQCPLER